MFRGDGEFSGIGIESEPLTTFRGHAGDQQFDGMGISAGNTTYLWSDRSGRDPR
jgi:hypothetical protein